MHVNKFNLNEVITCLLVLSKMIKTFSVYGSFMEPEPS